MAFVDEAVLFVRAGNGGDGSAHLHSEPYKPRGGPDGGDGGPGGSASLEVSGRVRDLSFFADHPHQAAGNGRAGSRNNRTGAAGKDLVLPVPDGTIVHDEQGLLADLVGVGSRAVVARGGRGGRGNASLAGPRHRLPRTAEAGEPGEERRIELELRIVADVGLVGLPNAGKSTLLSRLSAARPKIAPYPFTTLTPNIGVTEGERRFVVADVPGVVEGAHAGKGLGHRFLRHVSRCRVLMFVVDLSSEDPAGDLATVGNELAAYDRSLTERPSVVAGTKSDLVAEPDAVARRLGPGAMALSGLSGQGVDRLVARVGELVAAVPDDDRRSFVALRPARPPFVVRREGDRFRVVGKGVERWVTETDFDDPRGIAALQRRLAREGVERQLASMGARRGDEVVIGERAFEFIPEEDD